MSATAKNIILRADPRKPESATYIIEIPGADVEITRIDPSPSLGVQPEGLEYWVHVAVNHEPGLDESNGFAGRLADVIDARFDASAGGITHMAVRIRVREQVAS